MKVFGSRCGMDLPGGGKGRFLQGRSPRHRWAEDDPDDKDHLWGVGGDEGWVWTSFLRGMNPIYMNPFFEEAKHEAVRQAMGQTWHFAAKMNLAAMCPRPDLSSTRYCLAALGKEYLIYQPAKGAFTVRLPGGEYEAVPPPAAAQPPQSIFSRAACFVAPASDPSRLTKKGLATQSKKIPHWVV